MLMIYLCITIEEKNFLWKLPFIDTFITIKMINATMNICFLFGMLIEDGYLNQKYMRTI